MTTSAPRISVIVPTFNQGRFIEQTLLSIEGQSYPDLEIIVVDGGSTDETRSVLERHDARLTRWVSEPDRGQAHAINKGFRMATGSILAWLNSDDLYMPGALLEVARRLGDATAPKLVYGGCLHFFDGSSRAFTDRVQAHDRRRLTRTDYIIQPSAFWTRALWEAAGEVDESLHFVMDWDWFIRASRAGEFERLDAVLSLYRHHDGHKTGAGGARRAREVVALVEKYDEAGFAPAYRDLAERFDEHRRAIRVVEKLHAWRLRKLALPRLYAKHGADKIDAAIGMLF